MQELEKILEEIDGIKVGYDTECRRECNLYDWSCGACVGECDEYIKGRAKEIVRKHINDGWIPVEERLPEAPEMEDEYPEFNVMIEGAKNPTTLQYTHEGIWVDDYGNAYDVIAWQPLPEPYIPRNQNKPEDHYPEWRAKFLNKFDRRL